VSAKTEARPKQKNLDDIRVVLSDAIDDLREGKSSAATVNAISNASGKILSTVKLEMEYFKLLGKVPNIPMLMNGERPMRGEETPTEG
jgi:hypothetical protein